MGKAELAGESCSEGAGRLTKKERTRRRTVAVAESGRRWDYTEFEMLEKKLNVLCFG
jgi:hypothetical protein